MTKNERCGLCGGNAEPVRERVDMAIGRRSALVEVERFRCSQCGEAFYTPDQMRAAQIAASSELRRQDRLLSSHEIRSIREQYHLSQSQFERLLGAGPKTVVRWERGTVFQNRATDALLRVIRAVPEAARFLAELNSVECPSLKAEFRTPTSRAVAIDFHEASRPPATPRKRGGADVFLGGKTERAIPIESVEVEAEKAGALV